MERIFKKFLYCSTVQYCIVGTKKRRRPPPHHHHHHEPRTKFHLIERIGCERMWYRQKYMAEQQQAEQQEQKMLPRLLARASARGVGHAMRPRRFAVITWKNYLNPTLGVVQPVFPPIFCVLTKIYFSNESTGRRLRTRVRRRLFWPPRNVSGSSKERLHVLLLVTSCFSR